MKRLVLAFTLATLLGACGGSNVADLEQFVRDTEKSARGKVEPLPAVKPYEPFAYNAFDLPDPFKPRKLTLSGGNGRLAPDLTRPKEALENYPLEGLKMVGTLDRKGDLYAVVKTPDNATYRVHKGNYIGQNFGRVTAVLENEVKLTEVVQDSGGDWTERQASLMLQEQ
jgi:type IV pilus assembly protein PilP